VVAENRILKPQLQGRLGLPNAERARLREIGHRLAARLWRRWRPLPYLTPSWDGTEDWSRANSIDHEDIDARADLQSTKKLRDAVTRQDCQLLPHKMKRQTLLAKVEFRFHVRDLERFDVRGRRPALARLAPQPFQLVCGILADAHF